MISLSILNNDDHQCISGTFFCTLAARDALERLHLVGVVEHRLIRAKAHAGQAAHAYLFTHAHDTPLILGKRARGTDLDTLAALDAKNGAEVIPAIIVDADVGLFSVGDLEPGFGAGLLADVAADAEIRVVG
jgi:hypothetical protein